MFAGIEALSLLGTPFAQHFPKCLPSQDTAACPWDPLDLSNVHSLTTRPEKGVTRYYDFTITQEKFAPDGVEVQMIVANRQFPGPLIECNWGDTVEVTVHNNMSTEGASLHWHGMLQYGLPWMDGVSGVSQCPIAPEASFTYKFKPDLYGTSWWHSHWEGQYASGLAGPVVIYGPNHVDYDIDVGPITVNDWFHEYYSIISSGYLEDKPKVTLSDNNLINGKNSYNDNGAPLASFNFTSGKVHRLRLINTAAFAVEKITIDGYKMTVIANDFTPLEPYETDVVTLSPGQRTDVLVHGTGAPTDSMWLRAYKPPDCSPGYKGSYNAIAAIYYEQADRSKPPTTQPGPHAFNDYCGNDALSKTVPKIPIKPPEPSVTEILPIELRTNDSADLWYMGNRTLRIDFNEPQLLSAMNGDFEFPYIQNVHNYGSNTSVRLIFENPGDITHPMHIHGHSFWVLAEGHCGDTSIIFPKGQEGEQGHMKTASELSRELGGDKDVDRRRSHDSRDVRVVPSGDFSEVDSRADSVRRERAMNHVSRATFIGDYGTCWDGTIVNPNNPQRRDSHMLLPQSYIVIQWDLDNPGIWPLHCHTAWHLSAGMAMMVLERPDDLNNYGLEEYISISNTIGETCKGWDTWSNGHTVEQVDDGI
ncbi:Cupredoxin [Xylariaceae sp. FL0255]|nr:Cupredoxin [Xylariaceae sp. FL0255]